MKFAFFGTPDIAVASLDALFKNGLVPSVIVTAQDMPAGRGKIMTPPPVKVWAIEHGVPYIQPTSMKRESFPDSFFAADVDICVLVAFGYILPKWLLDLPQHGFINMHPSLLPKLRGPSPIRTAILNNDRDAVGVTVMKIDEHMDHGPILAQERVELTDWPLPGRELDKVLSESGGKLLAQTLLPYSNGTIIPYEQRHADATYCKMIKKSDAEIFEADPAEVALHKICAYDGWPGAFIMLERNGKPLRLKIISAHIDGDTLVYDRVIPEGKKEMSYTDFMRGHL